MRTKQNTASGRIVNFNLSGGEKEKKVGRHRGSHQELTESHEQSGFYRSDKKPGWRRMKMFQAIIAEPPPKAAAKLINLLEF